MPRIHDQLEARPPPPRRPPGSRGAPARRPPPAVAGPVAIPEVSRPPVVAMAALAGAFAACLAYGFVRYVVLKGEPLASVPLYVSNKALAVFSVVALAAYAAGRGAAWRSLARGAALAAGALHSLASLALLRPAYLGKLFEGGAEGRFTAAAEGALLCGVAALVALAGLRIARPPPAASSAPQPDPAAPSWPSRAARFTGLVALAAVVVHGLLLGGLKAFDVASWPGGMPPMTLLGAAIGLVALVAAAAPGRRASGTVG